MEELHEVASRQEGVKGIERTNEGYFVCSVLVLMCVIVCIYLLPCGCRCIIDDGGCSCIVVSLIMLFFHSILEKIGDNEVFLLTKALEHNSELTTLWWVLSITLSFYSF